MIGVICVAVLFAVVSVAIYVRNGTISLDLSRPGYAPVRKQIKSDDAPSFEATGRVDKAVVSEFRRLLKQETAEINKLGGFDKAAIDDEALQLKR